MLNIVAVSPTGGTRTCSERSCSTSCPARCCSRSTDPDDDDNGPGNYAYPTSPNFHDGAFDIEAFQVFDAGTDVIFRVRMRDLTATFGSPLGAQLVDIYVHDPAAATTSTAAAIRRATSRSRRRSRGAS